MSQVQGEPAWMTNVTKIIFPLSVNDSPQDALEFEYRIGFQIYNKLGSYIFDTFGNPLAPNQSTQ